MRLFFSFFFLMSDRGVELRKACVDLTTADGGRLKEKGTDKGGKLALNAER